MGENGMNDKKVMDGETEGVIAGETESGEIAAEKDAGTREEQSGEAAGKQEAVSAGEEAKAGEVAAEKDAGTQEEQSGETAGKQEAVPDGEETNAGEPAGEEAKAGEDREGDTPDAGEEFSEDWEDDLPDEDWEEDGPPVKPGKMIMVFLGLIAVAAVICFVFWKVTHDGKPGGDTQNTFLTADGNPSPAPEATQEPAISNTVVTQDGRVFVFTDCDDIITPKEYVNLRTEPSAAQGDATVSCVLRAGETAHRTGDSGDMGWSRVEYKGEILYVVTSNVKVVTE